jgi:hypothetical protein
MAIIGQYILPAIFIFGSLGSLLARKKKNDIFQGGGVQTSHSKPSVVRRYLLVPIVIIGTFNFVILMLKNEHSAVSTQLSNIVDVGSNKGSSVEMTSVQKLDAFEVTPDDGLESIGLIGLTGDEISKKQFAKTLHEDNVSFNEWYKAPTKCLASTDNPNPDINLCVNQRLRARKRYLSKQQN